MRKFRAKLFLYLDLRFILFWLKYIGAKAARNMLVKLTPARIYAHYKLLVKLTLSSSYVLNDSLPFFRLGFGLDLGFSGSDLYCHGTQSTSVDKFKTD